MAGEGDVEGVKMATERDVEQGTDARDVGDVVETASAVSKVDFITLLSLPNLIFLTPSPLFSLPKKL